MPSKGTLGEVQLLCRDTVIFRDVVKEAIIMAEVQIKPQIHELVSQGASSPVVQRPKMPAKVPDQISPAEEKLNKLRMEEAAKNDDIRTKEYGPVIAKSSDGDTVRVKKNDIEEKDERDKQNKAIYDATKNDAAKRQEEEVQNVELPEIEEYEPVEPYEPVLYEPGEFLKRTKQEAIKAQDSAQERNKEASLNSIQETMGSYSDSMLKEMYLQGKISQVNYELEMDAREQQREARNLDDKKFNEDMADDSERLREMERTEDVIRNIENFDINTSDNTVPLETRLQAMQNADAM